MRTTWNSSAWRAGVPLDVRVAELQASRSPPIRFAMLGHEPMIHPQRFGQVVATNRGAVVGVLTDEAMALNWLVPKKKST